MNDGMSSTQILVTQISGTTAEFTNVSGANVEIGAGGISAAELATDSVTSVKLSGLGVSTAKIAKEAVTVPKQAFVGTGSPAVWGNGIQFGTGTLSAGSTAWIVYTPAFKAAPNIIATSRNDSAINIIGAGSGTNTGTGSTLMVGTTASTTFNWIAVGSM